jgi:uncharacterized protein DUF6429
MNTSQDAITSTSSSRAAGEAPASAEAVHDLSLLLMYLTSWKDRREDGLRFWKGYQFEVLDRLEKERSLIQSNRAKSAYLTDEGRHRAQTLLAHYGLEAADPWESTTG